jgi:hypothetical protein
MFDGGSQKKFTRGCAEAAAGYATAATAAYTDWASQALDFWCTALSGLDDSKATPTAEEKTAPTRQPVTRKAEPAFGLALADWCAFPWLDPRRYEAMLQFDLTAPPAFSMMALTNAVPLRGNSKSWPFAKAMIDSGVPRAVAWPAAEANAAALEAADAASRGMRQVMASYHTESGFASTVRSATPSLAAVMMTLGLFVPTTAARAWA